MGKGGLLSLSDLPELNKNTNIYDFFKKKRINNLSAVLIQCPPLPAVGSQVWLSSGRCDYWTRNKM